VLSTTATTGEGIVALVDAVEARKGVAVTAEDRAARALQRVRRLLADATAQRVRQLIRAVDGANVDDLCAQVQRGELGVDDAAARLLRQLQQPEDRDGA
ncbi:MAG: hypothetical protein QF384_20255, partial [Alphaproteobacteria bacterium]|nr:hypothetical protein [Alphaproteobacteria bacterium]